MKTLLQSSLFCTSILLAITSLGSPVLADCAATPWRCPPPAGSEPNDILGVPTRSDFWAPKMTFTDGGIGIDGLRKIYAVGYFDDGTSSAFTAFLRAFNVGPGTLVVLHSPGGNPYEGMDMGRSIRQSSLRTSVGQRSPGTIGPSVLSDGPGLCASSCSLALLGGTDRSVPAGSLYGVHAVSLKTGGTIPDPLFMGQKIAADISAYLEAMGIDPLLLKVIAQFDSAKGETFYMPAALMRQLRVTTQFATSWELRNAGHIFSLVGSNPESSAFPGARDEVVFNCTDDRRRLVMDVNYLPEDARTPLGATARSSPTEFVSLLLSYTLSGFVAHETVQNQPRPVNLASSEVYRPLRVVDEHHVSVSIVVTPAIIELIKKADILTIAFNRPVSLSPELSVDLAVGREQINEFIATCH